MVLGLRKSTRKNGAIYPRCEQAKVTQPLVDIGRCLPGNRRGHVPRVLLHATHLQKLRDILDNIVLYGDVILLDPLPEPEVGVT